MKYLSETTRRRTVLLLTFISVVITSETVSAKILLRCDSNTQSAIISVDENKKTIALKSGDIKQFYQDRYEFTSSEDGGAYMTPDACKMRANVSITREMIHFGKMAIDKESCSYAKGFEQSFQFYIDRQTGVLTYVSLEKSISPIRSIFQCRKWSADEAF